MVDLDKLAWDEFLGRLDGNARRKYSKRRRCAVCRCPIRNSNSFGVCGSCGRKADGGARTRIKRPLPSGESRTHIELKSQAADFLVSLGCHDVRTEVPLGENGSRVVVDVIGENSEGTLVVECGGSQIRKLRKTKSLVRRVYILPYGSSQVPFLWQDNIRICRCCGNAVGVA